MIATSDSLDRVVFFDAIYRFCGLKLLTSESVLFDQQLSKQPINIKPKTTLIRTYRGYISLKLAYTNFFRTLYVIWTQFYTQFKN